MNNVKYTPDLYVRDKQKKLNIMISKKAVNLSLDTEVYKKIEKLGDDCGMTAGVLNLVSFYDKIMKLSKNELRGKFTTNEWIAIADSLNGSIIDEYTRYSVDMFIAHCEDAELYEGSFSSRNVEVKEFTEKCKSLTCAQLVALYDRVNEFWSNSHLDIEKWADF